MDGTFPFGEGFSTGSLIPAEFTTNDLLWLDAGAGDIPPDAHSGDTSNPSAAAADIGSRSPDLELNAGVGPESGGGALTEAAVRGSRKRKELVCGSSMQRSTPQFNFVETEASLVQSDPSSSDIKPPTDSTDAEIIGFLKERWVVLDGKEVNVRLGEQDRMAPKAVGSYVTTVEMMPDLKTHLGYWKEKQVEAVYDGDEELLLFLQPFQAGLKRTFQFHKYDDTKTNCFMDEYIPTNSWGIIDQYMEPLRFRKVYQGAEVPEVKIKKKTAAAKHRMRGPHNLVIKGESPAWQHFIKIYDRHPELEGSKVVYAVCCHCPRVLKADAENGTKSLLRHCNSTCTVKNKNQQQATSSR